MFSSIGVAGTPEGLNGGGLVSETALNNAQPGKVAFFGVGIESNGRVVPRGMSLEMNGGVEPIAPALDSLAGPEKRFGGVGGGGGDGQVGSVFV